VSAEPRALAVTLLPTRLVPILKPSRLGMQRSHGEISCRETGRVHSASGSAAIKAKEAR